MATRSMIAFDNGDEIYAIYCHNDGYPQHNGKILLHHYSDIEKVEELIELGDLSVLAKEIGEKQDFDQPTDRNWCLAYGRDRNEKGTQANTFYSLDDAVAYYDDCDYFYCFDGHGWLYKRHESGIDTDWRQLTPEECN